MSQARILVVDDDADLKEALQVWFSKRDCDVTFASNGNEGMMILRAGEPVDLVLTDFMMPELSGMELLRLVKSNVNLFSTKIVVMSSNTNPEFRKRAVEMGAIEYLSKVESAKDIVEKVVRILEGSTSGNGAVAALPEPAAAADVRLMTENLMDMLHVIDLVEGIPPAARSALASAQKLVERIQESTAPPLQVQ
jgi:CheY-like chemotaxis protein